MSDFESRIESLEKSRDVQGELMKEAVKEAIREWLNDMFARFGRWTFWGFAAALVAAFGYFILSMNGWRPPQ